VNKTRTVVFALLVRELASECVCVDLLKDDSALFYRFLHDLNQFLKQQSKKTAHASYQNQILQLNLHPYNKFLDFKICRESLFSNEDSGLPSAPRGVSFYLCSTC
jgi:hypothetical protein